MKKIINFAGILLLIIIFSLNMKAVNRSNQMQKQELIGAKEKARGNRLIILKTKQKQLQQEIKNLKAQQISIKKKMLEIAQAIKQLQNQLKDKDKQLNSLQQILATQLKQEKEKMQQIEYYSNRGGSMGSGKELRDLVSGLKKHLQKIRMIITQLKTKIAKLQTERKIIITKIKQQENLLALNKQKYNQLSKLIAAKTLELRKVNAAINQLK